MTNPLVAFMCVLLTVPALALGAPMQAESEPAIDQRLGNWLELNGNRALLLEEHRAGWFDGQNYALLFDRLQLRLGYLQRYGSQLTTIDGESLLMPCEDIARVDELRSEVGMGKLAQYLSLFRDQDTAPIRHLGYGQYEG